MAQDIDLNDAFAQRVLSLVSPEPWSGPKAFFNSDGDCIELLLSNDSYRARRLDSLVTVYESRDNGELVGRSSKAFADSSAILSSGFLGSRLKFGTAKSSLNIYSRPGCGRMTFLRTSWSSKHTRSSAMRPNEQALEVELQAV